MTAIYQPGVVAGLGNAESIEVLRAAGHALDPAVAEAVAAAVRGNPLGLLELPHVLTDQQRTGSRPIQEPLPVTHAVQQAFADRIKRLPQDARSSLLVAAEPSDQMPVIDLALRSLGLQTAAAANHGAQVSSTSVRRLLARAGVGPAPLSWRAFLRAQAASLLACDFLTVETVFPRSPSP
jgi:hypothetical protein